MTNNYKITIKDYYHTFAYDDNDNLYVTEESFIKEIDVADLGSVLTGVLATLKHPVDRLGFPDFGCIILTDDKYTEWYEIEINRIDRKKGLSFTDIDVIKEVIKKSVGV